MRLRTHHLLVLLGLGAGLLVATLVETDPAYLGWVFAIGSGLAGGAFLAAIFSGDALASGPPARTGRGARGRPAWFDEDDSTPAPGDAPRNERR
ncbi:MAG: hypothetical protein O2822_04650 [Chloroflexi bacterium]|nr:hypothetical protein [Chloroflexota bacterium]